MWGFPLPTPVNNDISEAVIRESAVNRHVPESLKEDARGFYEGADALRGGAILLVDDDPVVREVVSEMLVSLGYDVEIASSGIDALRIYEDKAAEISLVVLDMFMPDMGGEKVFTQLKILNSDVSVLVASGCCIDSQMAGMMDMGCRGFIQKPFHLTELEKKIKLAMRPVRKGGLKTCAGSGCCC